MSNPSGITIHDQCIAAYNQLRSGRGTPKPKFIIYRISDDTTTIILEDSSPETDYEIFLQRLFSAVDKDGNPAPRYGVYDVEYDLGNEGKRSKTVFIHWGPSQASIKLCMLYACSKEQLRKALDVSISIHADSRDELEWKQVLKEASGGKA
ncbi:uncharacterized protein N7511_001203 [Penicillium nucicola]|uniref:uncharacterized protein n=1 Tax=Penicillium nucicola TaxID=1850975 RepID=UPI0025450514|nr:uncharacterized protein N7511_001203 [Penicillium nucicola]KAJ5776192.1 hypothetical protein N7511_001203 [Penicillium nucicola]